MRFRFILLMSAVSFLMVAAPVSAQVLERVEPAFGSTVSSPDRDTAEKAVFLGQFDDGVTDLWVTPGDDTAEVAMLFDGFGGPDVTFGGTDFCWRRFGSDTEIRYDVVIWDDDGAGGSPGTELASFNAVATGVTTGSAFYSANVSYPLTDPSVYIGVRWNPVVDEDFSYCLDFDGIDGEVQPGYRRADEGTWFTFQSTQPDYNALMLRAFFSTPPPQPDLQIVPSYEVEATPSGTTTLFAVRNLTGSSNFVDITYYTREGVEQRVDSINLDAEETRTFNVRDIAGLAADPDGVKRGYIEVFGTANTDGTPTFAGDYFQVDIGNDFATGNRMRRIVDACEVESLRFAEFPLPGSGTEITAWLQFPQGTGGADPFSFRVRAYDEAGNFLGTTSFKTDRHVVKFQADEIAAVPFGTFEIDFENASRGFAYADSSVQGRFSIGVDSQCELP